MDYGKAIRVVRAVRGISQKALAEECGLDPSIISRIESSSRAPTLEVMESVSKGIAIPMHLLTLLASEKEDLDRVTVTDSETIGRELFTLLVDFRSESDEEAKL